MSSGEICSCIDPTHEIDPRSLRRENGVATRCRAYSVDQVRGGLCVGCAAAEHRGARQISYFHGGVPGLALGDRLLAPSVTGVRAAIDYADVAGVDPAAASRVRRDRIYLSTMIEAAAIFAAFHPSGRGELYEVDPVGPVEPDPDYSGAPGESVQVAEGIVRRRLGPLSFEDRSKILEAIAPSHERRRLERRPIPLNRHDRRRLRALR